MVSFLPIQRGKVMKWTLRRSREGRGTDQYSSSNDNGALDKGGTGAPEGGGGRPPLLYTIEAEAHKENGGEQGTPPEEGPDGGWGWVVAFGCFIVWVSN